MLKKVLMLTAATLIAVPFAIGHSTAEDAAFSEAQREEMHQIIRDYLVENPEVIAEALEALQVRQEEKEMARLRDNVRENADLLFHSDVDFVLGNPEGSVTMVEFFDYNCGYCKRSLSDVQALLETDSELRLVMKEFPILGAGSLAAAKAAIASIKQGLYWEFHVALMESRGVDGEDAVMRVAEDVGLDVEQLRADMQSADVDAVIQQNYALAELMGIQGTPAFLIDDRLIPGALGYDGLLAEITEVRDSGNCVAC